MSIAVVFSKDKTYADKSVDLVEGSSAVLSCTVWGTITATPTVAVYRNKVDVTSTVMPSGSHTYSGTVATLKSMTALSGNARYIVDVTLTVGGDVLTKKILVRCVKDEVE